MLTDISEEKPERRKSKGPRRSWKGFTLQMAQDFYEENYEGMNRGQVGKVNGSFYQFVRRNGWLDEVFPESFQKAVRDWSGYTLDMACQYYSDNFAGKIRSEVMKLDSGFYTFVIRKGWQDDIFPEPERIDWSEFDLEKSCQYYEENYAGKTRSEVNNEDPRFVSFVRRMDWLDDVFPAPTARDWSGYDAEKTRDYYETHYEGLSRGQVAKKDPAFYAFVCNNRWLDEVFPESKYRDWSGFDEEKCREYYEENLSGLSRSQVQKKHSGFYHYLHKQGLVEVVLPKSQNAHHRDWSGLDLQKAKEYYEENYPGMTRMQVQKIDQKFYNLVGEKGWRDDVFPPAKTRPKKPNSQELRVIKDLLEDGLGDPSEQHIPRRPYYSPEMIPQPEMRF